MKFAAGILALALALAISGTQALPVPDGREDALTLARGRGMGTDEAPGAADALSSQEKKKRGWGFCASCLGRGDGLRNVPKPHVDPPSPSRYPAGPMQKPEVVRYSGVHFPHPYSDNRYVANLPKPGAGTPPRVGSPGSQGSSSLGSTGGMVGSPRPGFPMGKRDGEGEE